MGRLDWRVQELLAEEDGYYGTSLATTLSINQYQGTRTAVSVYEREATGLCGINAVKAFKWVLHVSRIMEGPWAEQQ